MRRKIHALLDTGPVITKQLDGKEVAIIEGIATSPTPDRMGDVVLSDGAEFKLPLPMLWQHSHWEPVGQWTAAEVTEEGIKVRGEIPLDVESETLRRRIDEAVESVRRGLVRGLSIGFRAIEYVINPEDYTFEFRVWEWLETSLVTIPANSDANIQTVRAYDAEYKSADPAALGNEDGGPKSIVVRMDSETIRRVRLEPTVKR